MFTVIFHDEAEKEFTALPAAIIDQALRRLEEMQNEI